MTTRHEVDLLRRRAFAGSLPRSRRKGAFNPITHILLGWLIAHLGSSTRALADLAVWTKERRCACGRARIRLCQLCRTPLCPGHALSLGRSGLGCADGAATGSGKGTGKSG
ncbi:MAG: hypothetical protein HYY25_03175 [Candidatus Wallbacteria bacterium]|nr:hypothetical protein [Candidatus Wallbacteria bacterium]